MAAALGIGVGSVNSVAALDLDGADAADVTVFSRESVLHLTPDRAPLLGAQHSSLESSVVSDFANRVGDPVGLLTDDGSTYSGEDLVATAVGCLVHEAASDGGPLPTTVVTHPTVWSPYTVGVLASALEQAGLTDTTLVSEADAVMAWLAHTRGPLGDGVTVIYDLGGNSLDVTLMGTGTHQGVLGKPVRSEDFGGAQFDHKTMQHALGNVAEQFGSVDAFAPESVAALTELRSRCTLAKETLSFDTETVIAIALPGIATDVRLVRSELEDLIREPLLDSVALIRESIQSAGLELTDVSQVVLTGGSSAIPLVAELISAQLRVPVTAGERPAHTAALGAAILASARSAAPTTRIPAQAAARPAAAARTVPPFVKAEPATDIIAHAGPAPAAAPVAAAQVADAREGMSRSKKLGIAAASAAAIALLAAAGLSLGTPFDTSPTPGSRASTSQPSDVAPLAPELAGSNPSGTAAPAAAVTNSSAPGDPAGAPVSVLAPGTAAPGTVAPGTPAAPGTQAPATAPGTQPAPAAAAGQPAAPAPQPPAGNNAPPPVNNAPPIANQPQPAYTPPPSIDIPQQPPVYTLPTPPILGGALDTGCDAVGLPCGGQ